MRLLKPWPQGIWPLGCSLLIPGLEGRQVLISLKHEHVIVHFDKHYEGYEENAKEESRGETLFTGGEDLMSSSFKL